MNEPVDPRRPPRRGVALIVAIVCLAVASALLISVARLSVARRSASRAQEWRAQAGRLADSAVERAAARLRENPKYPGETWNVPADALGGSAGVVRIEIHTPTDRPESREVRVTADYPDAPEHRARESRRALVTVANLTGDKP
jgi:Tfp pilus assembly protein PilX